MSRVRHHVTAVTLAATSVLGVATVGSVGATPPAATLTAVAELNVPVDLTWRTGDEALYVVGQDGVIRRVVGGEPTVALDITDLTAADGERGLLGLAFTPDGALAYINFTDQAGATNVAELTVAGDGSLDRASMRTVLVIEQPYPNHNGGDLAFGIDGMLYIGMGDGGDGGDPDRRAQDLGELLGKMLRIDPTTPSGDLGYSVPSDNPFVGVDGARAEIWSVGLRNPWRFSFDAETGDLWIADVGQSAVEEVNAAPATDGAAGRGANFGWSAFEGTAAFNDDVTVDAHVPPVYEYAHENDRCSISGGVRARGTGAGSLAGSYVFADYCSGEVFTLAVTDGASGPTIEGEMAVLATTDGEQITAVTSGPDGAVYVLVRQGNLYRLDPAA